ncbi:MAG: ABC transporter substrate binding protein, partial [Betaproteobacteria bacterium]
LGFDLSIEEVDTVGGFEPAFARVLVARADAIITHATPLNVRERKRIAEFASRNRLATTSDSKWFVEAGGLISYGPDLAQLGVSSARYIDLVLRGARPSDIPIELPSRYELVVNLGTAKRLGLTVPQSLLVRADRVIE